METIITKVSKCFLILGDVVHVDSHLNGLVNKTYLVKTRDEAGLIHEYIIQRINTFVFKKPDELMENIVRVTNHIREKPHDNLTLEVIFTKTGSSLVKEEGSYYRCYQYMKNSRNYQLVENIQQFKEVGRAVGQFQKHLSDFPVDSLHEIIPNFHNTPIRLNQLIEAVKRGNQQRINESHNQIKEFLKQKKEIASIQLALENQQIPYRVTHNDTKLNNVMFDQETNRSICLIDLDTVMPGTALYDYGDALRVGASTLSEDDPNIELVKLDYKKFIAFSAGYISQVGHDLTEKEYELLAKSVYIITLECGMRFLTDYLLDDCYFLTNYDQHNLIRTKNQLQLAQDIKTKLPKLHLIINELRIRILN